MSILICCPILEKDNFIEKLYITLSCLIKNCSFFNFICFDIYIFLKVFVVEDHSQTSSQCSTTGVTKAVVCAILSVGWCI